jgi:hypothetical protein
VENVPTGPGFLPVQARFDWKHYKGARVMSGNAPA